MTTFRYSAHNVDTSAPQRSLRSVTISATMTQPEALALIRQQAQEIANERNITVVIREQTVKADRTIQATKDLEMVSPFIADTDEDDTDDTSEDEDDSDEATEDEEDMATTDTQTPATVTMEYVTDNDMDFLEDAHNAPATQTEEEKATDALFESLDTDDFTPEIITEHIDAAGDVVATDEGKATVSVELTKADGTQTTVEMTPEEANLFECSIHPNTVDGFASFIDQENNVSKTAYVIADDQTPDAYYGFGFQVIEARGDFLILAGPAEHAEWQISRLASGMHAGHMQPCEELLTTYMIIDDKMDIRAHRNTDGMATDSAEYQQIAAEVHASIAAGATELTPAEQEEIGAENRRNWNAMLAEQAEAAKVVATEVIPLDDEDAALIARAEARKSNKAPKKAKGGPRVIHSSYAVNGIAGLAGETTTQITKALIREYYCPQAGIVYPDALRPFLLRCETHQVDAFFPGYRIARDTAAHSDTWCAGCKAIVDAKTIAG